MKQKQPAQREAPAPAAVVAPTPAAVIPAQDVQTTDIARKKAMATQRQKGGVASTVLSDKLGG